MASYISDGYTRDDGYIAAAPEESNGERLYESLEFTYRPATRMELIKLDAEVEIASKSKEFDPESAIRAEKIACKFIASKILSWSLTSVGIHPVPVSAESLERMNSYLFGNLYRIIRGSQTSDVKPNVTPKPSDEDQVKN